METEHSKVEWEFKAQGDANEYCILALTKEGKWVAAIKLNGEMTVSQQLELLKLMTAAPDMIDALLAANSYFVDLQNKCALTNSDERAWKLISKAIKKATYEINNHRQQ